MSLSPAVTVVTGLRIRDLVSAGADAIVVLEGGSGRVNSHAGAAMFDIVEPLRVACTLSPEQVNTLETWRREAIAAKLVQVEGSHAHLLVRELDGRVRCFALPHTKIDLLEQICSVE